MNRVIQQFSIGAVALAVMQVASAQLSITNIVPMNIPGQGTEIRVMFNGLPPQPKAYQLQQPAKLILDFDKTEQSLKKNNIAISSKEASSIEVQSDANRARLTVNLKDAGTFATGIEGNTFILRINNKATPAAAVALPTSTPVATAIPAATQNQGIANIGFQKGTQGEGQVVIDLLGSNTPVDVQQKGSKVFVRLLGNKIPTHLVKRLNVNEFSTPISNIDAYNENGSGVIVVQAAGGYEYLAYQAENKLTLSLKRPESRNPLQGVNSQAYNGKKISLDFQDIEVRRVLQLLADFTDINMVTADSVQGNITLRLKDVPWDQALDIILKTKNLAKRRSGNVIWIAPVTELSKAEADEAKANAQSIQLAPLQTEYIQLSYAKASDIEKLLIQGRDAAKSSAAADNSLNASDISDPNGEKAVSKGAMVAGSNTSSGSLLSPRGTVAVDARTNTLIINDTPQKIDQIRKMIDLLDVRVKQVMIEARIVLATTSFTKEMGVKWGVLASGSDAVVGNNTTTLWNLKNPGSNGKFDIDTSDNLNVDLGVTTSGASSIAFGLINLSDFMLDLELSALQADGYGEVVSTPKVMTADKQTAKVATGQEVPYQTTTNSASGSTANTSFKEALLSLEVTPSITPDGKIQMQLNITKDSVAETASNGQPILNKNLVNTNVLVDNGETVILGGIFEQTTTNTQTKVPFLGDIPYVGRLFRKDAKSDKKQELLIFVTPRIVNDTQVRN